MARLRFSDDYWVELVNRVKGVLNHRRVTAVKFGLGDFYVCGSCYASVAKAGQVGHQDWHDAMGELAKHVARAENPELRFKGDPLRVDRD